jgi:hypothetical protein
MAKKRIFLCAGNSARRLMQEPHRRESVVGPPT